MLKCDFNKVALLKSHFGMGVLLQICCMFSEHLFLRTFLEGCLFSVIILYLFSVVLCRGVFRTQSNICDGPFCENSWRLKAVNCFWKKSKERSSTGFYTCLCYAQLNIKNVKSFFWVYSTSLADDNNAHDNSDNNNAFFLNKFVNIILWIISCCFS